MGWTRYEDDEQQSEFNSNIASLKRIDIDMQILKKLYNGEEWEAMFKQLRSMRLDIRYKMKHTIKDEKCIPDCKRCKGDKLFSKLNKTFSYYNRHRTDKNIVNRFAKELDNFALFLIDFMGEKGMLLRDAADEATHALK